MKKYIGLLTLISAIGIAVLLTATRAEPPKKPKIEAKITVPTIELRTESIQDRIIANGTIQPRWQTTLSSEVSGRVLSVSNQLLEGAKFKQGQPLIEIESSDYRAALSEAKFELASVKRQYEEEQQRAQIAKENWQESGIEGKPSTLTLRQPQLEELKAQFESAKAAVQRAEYDLSQTRITAPYNGVVIERMVNPGSTLQVGSDIATIYDSGIYEIAVPLNDKQFRRLPNQPIGLDVIFSDSEEHAIGHGKIIRIDQRIDPTNRWRNVHIEITETKNLLPGQFVTVAIPGKQYEHALTIPEKFIGSDGSVWFVDDQNRLQQFSADVLFVSNHNAVINPSDALPDPLQLTINRNTYLPGAKVVPEIQFNTQSNLAALNQNANKQGGQP